MVGVTSPFHSLDRVGQFSASVTARASAVPTFRRRDAKDGAPSSESCLVSDAPHLSSSWVGIAMLSRRTWCGRALLALLAGLPLVTPMSLLAGLPLVTLLSLLAGLPLVTLLALLAGLPLVTAMSLLTGLPLVTLLALLAGLPLLSRGPLLRSWVLVATANKYG